MQHIQNDCKNVRNKIRELVYSEKMLLYSLIERDPKLKLVKIGFGFIGFFCNHTLQTCSPFPLVCNMGYT